MDRLEIGLWHLEQRGKRCVEALRKNGFDALFLPDRESVRSRLLAECEKAVSIGFGGSMSVAEMGIHEALRGEGEAAAGPRPGPRRGKGRRAPGAAHLRPLPVRDQRDHAERVPRQPRHEREPDERDDVRAEEDRRGRGGEQDRRRRGGGDQADQGRWRPPGTPSACSFPRPARSPASARIAPPPTASAGSIRSSRGNRRTRTSP